MSAEGRLIVIWEFSHICVLHTIAAHNCCTDPCCCALQVQERAVPSLIAAASPAAAAAVVRTYQAPAAGPLLLQYRGRQGPDCQGFPPRPHWSDVPVRVTSALLCSAKISAHPVWLLQGHSGLNLSSDILSQNIHINHALNFAFPCV